MNTATPAATSVAPLIWSPAIATPAAPIDRDHGRLQLEAALGEAVADRDQERRDEDAQRERHRQRLAVQSRDRVAVGAAEHHHEDHRPAERTQRLSLPMQALLSTRPSLRYPLAVRR